MRIVFTGPAPAVRALAQILREDGPTVDFTAPVEYRGAGAEIARDVLIPLLVNGACGGIKASVIRFLATRMGRGSQVDIPNEAP